MLRTIGNASDLGEAVRVVRKAQGITQADLALVLGKSHVLLRNLEKGTGSVSIANVLQVLDELGIRLYMDLPDR